MASTAAKWPNSDHWAKEFTARPDAFFATDNSSDVITARLGSQLFQLEICSRAMTSRTHYLVSELMLQAATEVAQVQQDAAAERRWLQLLQATVQTCLAHLHVDDAARIAVQYRLAASSSLAATKLDGITTVIVKHKGHAVGQFSYLNPDALKVLFVQKLTYQRVVLGTLTSPEDLAGLLGTASGLQAVNNLINRGYTYSESIGWRSTNGLAVIPLVPMLFVDGGGDDCKFNLTTLKLPNVQGLQLPAIGFHPYATTQAFKQEVEQLLVMSSILSLQKLAQGSLEIAASTVVVTPLLLRADMLAAAGSLGVIKNFRPSHALPLHMIELHRLHSVSAAPFAHSVLAAHPTPFLRYAQAMWPATATMCTDVAPYCALHLCNSTTGSILNVLHDCAVHAGISHAAFVRVAAYAQSAPRSSWPEFNAARQQLDWQHSSGGRYESKVEQTLQVLVWAIWRDDTFAAPQHADTTKKLCTVLQLWSSMLQTWHCVPILEAEQRQHCQRCVDAARQQCRSWLRDSGLPVPSHFHTFKWIALAQYCFAPQHSCAALGPTAGYSCENVIGEARTMLKRASGNIDHTRASAQQMRRLSFRCGLATAENPAGSAASQPCLQQAHLGSSMPAWWGCIIRRPILQLHHETVSGWLPSQQAPAADCLHTVQGVTFRVGDYVSSLATTLNAGGEEILDWQLWRIVLVDTTCFHAHHCFMLDAAEHADTGLQHKNRCSARIPPSCVGAGSHIVLPKGHLPTQSSAIQMLANGNFTGHPILASFIPVVENCKLEFLQLRNVVQKEYTLPDANSAVAWWRYRGVYNAERPEK